MTMAKKSTAELLSVIVGPSAAKGLASRPLAELFGFTSPRQGNLVGEDIAPYGVHPAMEAARELLARAFEEQMEEGVSLSSPQAVRGFLTARIAGLGHEVFWVLYLDSQNRLLAAEEMFRGTLTQTSVYPREIVKRALEFNCHATILAHNHPSGLVEPSQADRWLTDQLKAALGMVDVRVLDHFVIGGAKYTSFAERGWL